MLARRILTAFALLTILAFALAPTAAAHKTYYTEDGTVKIVWGFRDEPAVTWMKNGLDLILTDNQTGEPVEGAEDTVEAYLRHGNDEMRFEDFRAAHGDPGHYTGVVTLTKPGVYTLVLRGEIAGSAVNVSIPSAHEIHGIDETFFPPVTSDPFATGGDASALEGRIATLESELAALKQQIATQSQTPATVTKQETPGANDAPAGGILLVALAAVAAALALRRP